MSITWHSNVKLILRKIKLANKNNYNYNRTKSDLFTSKTDWKAWVDCRRGEDTREQNWRQSKKLKLTNFLFKMKEFLIK